MGVWIETVRGRTIASQKRVTPYVGVWIETYLIRLIRKIRWSLLMWVCGFILVTDLCILLEHAVTPYVGVWIETGANAGAPFGLVVTPYVGVWIETLFG